jgi:hypothetical protein
MRVTTQEAMRSLRLAVRAAAEVDQIDAPAGSELEHAVADRLKDAADLACQAMQELDQSRILLLLERGL